MRINRVSLLWRSWLSAAPLIVAVAAFPAQADDSRSAWQVDVYYPVGSIVSYRGHLYRALVSQVDFHDSNWNPRDVESMEGARLERIQLPLQVVFARFQHPIALRDGLERRNHLHDRRRCQRRWSQLQGELVDAGPVAVHGQRRGVRAPVDDDRELCGGRVSDVHCRIQRHAIGRTGASGRTGLEDAAGASGGPHRLIQIRRSRPTVEIRRRSALNRRLPLPFRGVE